MREATTKAGVLAEAERGEGCLGRSGNAEPVFVLCGRDPVAAEIIREWADRREQRAVRLGTLYAGEKEKITGARNASLVFEAWFRAHTTSTSNR